MPRPTFAIASLLFLTVGSTAAAADDPICSDRPSKSTGACTVPKGKLQIETGLVDFTTDKADGVRTNTILWGSLAIKYGISDHADIELIVTPLETLKVHGGGMSEHHSSFGDTVLRVKYALTGDDAPIKLAIDPFVKLPTANRELGNNKFEAGLLIPISHQFGTGPLTLSLDPELDWLADHDGRGHHSAMQQVINLGYKVTKKLNLSAELWGQWDWDPAETSRQASADGSVAYLVSDDLQLDAGANLGLNGQTPDVEVYGGVSVRFR